MQNAPRIIGNNKKSVGNTSITENKKQWEQFAKHDALFYIDTTAKNSDQFWKKGEENFRSYILPILKQYSIANDVAIDFGCGVGRLTFPLAKYFKRVLGVDVSDKMLERARVIAGEKNITNAEFIENDVFFSSTEPVDFIYCANVFQHIEDLKQIELILAHMSRLLRGYTYAHFDTRPQSWLYRLKNKLPDFLLPRLQRRGIRRIRRDAVEIKNLIKKVGFSIIAEQQPDSEYHFLLLKKS